MTIERNFTAELVEDDDPAIGQERIRVRHADGRIQELRLHDYDELYALPGVYEQIVHERLGCCSPAEVAALLAAAVDELGWERDRVRVIDIAAGNGISGEALVAAGLHPVLGSDLVASARAAVLRDRPDVYDAYLTLDLLALSDADRSAIGALHANALSCVAPVGEHASELPPGALVAAAALLAPDALAVYMHDPHRGVPDALTSTVWREAGTFSPVPRMNSAKLPWSHSVWHGSTEFSICCSQLHGTTERPRLRIAPSTTKPSKRGMSGAGNGPR